MSDETELRRAVVERLTIDIRMPARRAPFWLRLIVGSPLEHARWLRSVVKKQNGWIDDLYRDVGGES